jgi:hypothetical protein
MEMSEEEKRKLRMARFGLQVKDSKPTAPAPVATPSAQSTAAGSTAAPKSARKYYTKSARFYHVNCISSRSRSKGPCID